VKEKCGLSLTMKNMDQTNIFGGFFDSPHSGNYARRRRRRRRGRRRRRNLNLIGGNDESCHEK
jgi:hypothetical protein